MENIEEKRFYELVAKLSDIQKILVLGDIGVDKYTMGSIGRISPEAPVIILEVVKEWYKLGLAANVVDNFQSLEVNSILCGATGMDLAGDVFENLLEEKGLSTWGIVRTKERKTTMKERVTTNVQQVCRIDYEQKNHLDPKTDKRLRSRVWDFIQESVGVIIEDYSKGVMSESLYKELIRTSIEAKKFIAVDPGKDTPPLWYKGVNLLKPNRLEAERIVQALGHKTKTLREMAHIIVEELELEKLVITLGADGMAMIDTKSSNQELRTIPTVSSEIYDVSGAGDTAMALICAGILAGGTLQEAIWLGNCGAAVVVSKRGTATVTRQELLDFYQNKWGRKDQTKEKKLDTKHSL